MKVRSLKSLHIMSGASRNPTILSAQTQKDPGTVALAKGGQTYIVEHPQGMINNRDLDFRGKGFIRVLSCLKEGHFSSSKRQETLYPSLLNEEGKQRSEIHLGSQSPGTQSPVILRCNPKVIGHFPAPLLTTTLRPEHRNTDHIRKN